MGLHGGKSSCSNSDNSKKALGAIMLSLNNLQRYVVKSRETIKELFVLETFKTKEICWECLGQIVKKYLGLS